MGPPRKWSALVVRIIVIALLVDTHAVGELSNERLILIRSESTLSF